MRKRMLSLILAAIMVCTMMIPAVSAAEVQSAENVQNPSPRSSYTDGGAVRTDIIEGNSVNLDDIKVTNRLYSVYEGARTFSVKVHTKAKVVYWDEDDLEDDYSISSAESVSVKVYNGTQTVTYETFYSTYYTGSVFQATIPDLDGEAADRSTATFVFRFDEDLYAPFSRRLEMTFDYSSAR